MVEPTYKSDLSKNLGLEATGRFLVGHKTWSQSKIKESQHNFVGILRVKWTSESVEFVKQDLFLFNRWVRRRSYHYTILIEQVEAINRRFYCFSYSNY